MSDTQFVLAERLEADTFLLGNLELCQVVLMNDSRFPWLILVPRRAGVSELFDLDAADRVRLVDECAYVAKILKEITGADKMNVATLGNAVPQLHVHVVARFKTDQAWPAPVWGFGNSQKLTDEEKDKLWVKLLEKIDFKPL